jgi:hypothetical protein
MIQELYRRCHKSRFYFANAHGGIDQVETTLRDRLATVGLGLLVLCTLGHFYNGFALFGLGGLAITLPFIFLVGAAAIGWFSSRSHPANDWPLFILLLLVVWQVVNAIIMGFAGEIEWLKSFGQLAFYTTCFGFANRIEISKKHVERMIPIIIAIMIVFGSLGIIECIMLNNLNMDPILLPELRISAYDPSSDIWRTDGFKRTAVFSIEPSTYSMALSVAGVLCIFCCRIVAFRHRILLIIAGLLLIGGSSVSLSPSGWLVGIGTLIVVALSVGRFRRIFLPIFLMVFFIISFIYSTQLLPVITERIDSIFSGNDTSTNVRILAALQLMFRSPTGLADFAVGYGLGMEESYRPVMSAFYSQFYSQFSTNINNIFTVIQITQGWGGMAIHITGLLVLIYPFKNKDKSLYLPLFAMFFLLHFASGFYIDPIFWGQFALISILRNADLEALRREEPRRFEDASRFEWNSMSPTLRRNS